MLKKIGKAFLIIVTAVLIIMIYHTNVNFYTVDATVYEVGSDYVTFEDTTGNLWDVDKENFDTNATYELTFYTNCTDEERIDDSITKIVKKDLTNE